MNLFGATSLTVSLCTYFLLVGGFMFIIAAIFSGFASMALADTKQFAFLDIEYAFIWVQPEVGLS
jgi:hypothetical protein